MCNKEKQTVTSKNELQIICVEARLGASWNLWTFVGILFNGSLNKKVMGQEAIYVTSVELNTHLPLLRYFNVVIPVVTDVTLFIVNKK